MLVFLLCIDIIHSPYGEGRKVENRSNIGYPSDRS
jgi:hypothetical protein